jgi:hypothetical protein
MASPAVERFLSALHEHGCRPRRSGSGWTSLCPAHELDGTKHRPSLSVGEGDDQRTLVECFAGCATEDVVASVGMTVADLFVPNGSRRAEPEAVYDYVDAGGELLFQVVRFPGKEFRQRRPDGGGGWIWNLNGVPRVLYRLPKVLEAVAKGETIFVVEGERDVAAAEGAGATATCNPAGAGKWRDAYSEPFAGAAVVVVADKDEPGLRHAREVARSLEGQAWSVEIVGPLEGKDLSDHLAAGHSMAMLEPLDAGESPEPALQPRQLVDGATFVLDSPTEVEAIWGEAEGRVLWASGEPLLLVAPQGVGKTTIAQRLTLGRIGLCPSLLGMPVARGEGRVLYLACDRPRQAQRSLARMVGDEDREALAERLEVWCGPLSFSLVKTPAELLRLAESVEATTVVIDSLKDVAPSLSSEESGQAIALALQELVATGVEVLALHHQRKAQADNRKPKTLADVYGSVWIPAACGSVALLWGEAGDVLIQLDHLKQPAEEVGPLKVVHDHHAGLPTLQEKAELEDLLRNAGVEGLTVSAVASWIFSKDTPSRNEIEKARRRLDRLAGKGYAKHIPSLVPTDAGRYVFDGPAEKGA